MGDEFHFAMNYSKFKTCQSQLIKKHHTIRSSAITFDKLMNSSKMLELKNLLHKYIYISVLYKMQPIHVYNNTYNNDIRPTWLYFSLSVQ